jgi:ABC-type polysaccharide/polyol phosphate export permease
VLAFAKIGISIHLLWVPLLIIFLFFLTASLSLLAACGALFFRDIKYIVDVILTFGIFFTPVFYDAGMFKEWKTLLLLNPMGAILENINTVVILHQPPDYSWLIYAGMWAVGGFLLSWVIFKKAEPLFAEYI